MQHEFYVIKLKYRNYCYIKIRNVYYLRYIKNEILK